MRTIFFLVGGCMLGSCVLGLAWRFGRGSLEVLNAALVGFIVGWFAIAAANLWMGVARAGYSVREELPIFALILVVPVGAALLLRRVLA